MYQQESFSSAFWRGFNRIPVVIRVVIGISVILFLFQALFGRIQIDGLSLNYYIVQYLGFDPSFKTAITQPWRFVTYIFLHGSGFHLLFNMLWLWWMGRLVEEQIGPRSFAVLFFGSGIGGAIFHIAFSFLYGTSHVIGASGAVFGVMVAFAYLFPRIPIMLIFFPPIEARYVVAGLIAFDVLLLGSGDNIARLVHLGGAFTGYQLIKAHARGKDLSAIIRPFENMWRSRSKPVGKAEVRRKPRNRKMHSVTDVEVIDEISRDELDLILEKISKHGYDGLTKEEKRKLFELSKKD